MNNQPIPVKESPVKKFIPGIAWFFLVLIIICLPGSNIPQVENWLNLIYFDKWVHAALFAVLVFLFIKPVTRLVVAKDVKNNIAIKITIAAIIWGITTEFIQKFFIPGRHFDLFDIAADSLGALTAYTWCRIKYIH